MSQIKDELIAVTDGLKLSVKPNETWLHFSTSKGDKCTFCIENKFPAICTKVLRQ